MDHSSDGMITALIPQIGVFAEEHGVHMEVTWTDEELDELFGEVCCP